MDNDDTVTFWAFHSRSLDCWPKDTYGIPVNKPFFVSRNKTTTIHMFIDHFLDGTCTVLQDYWTPPQIHPELKSFDDLYQEKYWPALFAWAADFVLTEITTPV